MPDLIDVLVMIVRVISGVVDREIKIQINKYCIRILFFPSLPCSRPALLLSPHSMPFILITWLMRDRTEGGTGLKGTLVGTDMDSLVSTTTQYPSSPRGLVFVVGDGPGIVTSSSIFPNRSSRVRRR